MKKNMWFEKMFSALKETIMNYAWWEITIFIIGILSFVSLLVVFFLPLGNGPKTFTYSGEVPSVESPEFIPLLSHSLNLPVRQGKSVEVINDGDTFLSSLLADIDNAHTSINIMVYIWSEGKMSDQVLEHLNQKLKDGVQVRVMIDAVGSGQLVPGRQFSEFKKLGGKIEEFRSLTVVPWHFTRNQSRNHRRAIVIDGNIGYTGGMTIDDSWLGKAKNPEEFRDLMFRTTGPMAQDMQGAFSELWTSTTAEILVGDNFYPLQSSTQDSGVSRYVSLASTPSLDSLALQKFILLSVLGAKQKLFITTPYFLPDESFRGALIQRAQAGVDVRVLVPNELNDSQAVYYASHYSYEELLEGGVKIYEYQPTFIHTKVICIDGIWTIIGSANMDNRSRKINGENIFGISDKILAGTLESVFFEDLTHAKQIDLTEWKERSLWQRVREYFDLKFVKQS